MADANEPSSKPLVSIIIAVKNSENTLAECLNSIAAQPLNDVELIVIDGKSDDGTLPILKSFGNVVTHLVSERDSGIYSAWNKGLKFVSGEWVLFLGGDDFLKMADLPATLRPILKAVPSQTLVAYGLVELQASGTSESSLLGVDWPTASLKFSQGQMIPNPGTFYRAGYFKKHGAFDESFRIAGDYEMRLRELPTNVEHFLAGTIVTGMHPGGISSSLTMTILQWREVRRAQIMHGQKLPSYYWIVSMARAQSRNILRMVLGVRMSSAVVATVRSFLKADA
jgi:glycosyltransferase involved in cell wall biosynthesis